MPDVLGATPDHPDRPEGHDVVVVGASMGGVEALRALAAGLPAEFPAAVVVVVHTAADGPGLLAEVLDHAGPLPAAFARDGEPLQPGHIVVAPPDAHVLLTERGVRLSRGARENRARPAVDPLFRSAAVTYRSRVIGVILTGYLDDGAAGLRAIAQCGGLAVVQDDAAYPDMPRAALAAVPKAHRVALDGLAALLQDLVARPAPVPPPVPQRLADEARITERGMADIDTMDRLGPRSSATCPDCGGTLWLLEKDDTGSDRYRCHTGHAYTEQTLYASQTEATEQALYVALRTLEQRAQMLRRMAEQYGTGYAGHADELDRHADILRGVLVQTHV
ncbi:MAG TPA: chemotaxis protein CheB [Rubricoccaceae bacterium]